MSFGKVKGFSNFIQEMRDGKNLAKRKLSEINYGHDFTLESGPLGNVATCKNCSMKMYFYDRTNEWIQEGKIGPTLSNKGKEIQSCSEYKMSEALE